VCFALERIFIEATQRFLEESGIIAQVELSDGHGEVYREKCLFETRNTIVA